MRCSVLPSGGLRRHAQPRPHHSEKALRGVFCGKVDRGLLAGLERGKGFFRSRIAKRLQLRYTPDLRFYVDDQLEQAVAMTSLLNSLVPREEE